MEQLSIFDMMYERYRIERKIRLIELFARRDMVVRQWH